MFNWFKKKKVPQSIRGNRSKVIEGEVPVDFFIMHTLMDQSTIDYSCDCSHEDCSCDVGSCDGDSSCDCDCGGCE